jgi:hypothetical protein
MAKIGSKLNFLLCSRFDWKQIKVYWNWNNRSKCGYLRHVADW